MKVPAAIFAVALFCALLVRAAVPSQAWVTFIWEYTNTAATVDCFYVYVSTNVLNPPPWECVTNAPGSNRTVTVLMKPANYFFYCTASNMWGESGPSNQIGTPAPVTDPSFIGIRR